MKQSNYYHYTSIKTLFSIITNDELWLSNLKNSNDPNEFYLTCDEYNAYVSKLGRDPYNGKPYVLEENGIYGNTYGLSFTLVGDNLSQWERYGDSLSGVSICFDIDLMQKTLEEKYDFTFDFDAVKYTEEKKSSLLKAKSKRFIGITSRGVRWRNGQWKGFISLITTTKRKCYLKKNLFMSSKSIGCSLILHIMISFTNFIWAFVLRS